MPLLNEPFSFNYFGHIITARSLGPAAIPGISKITSAHVVPFAEDGRIVAVNIINRGWDIPGGHIDEGELSPQDALRREAREEANISILEPVLIDVLFIECETLDIKTKPYILIYAAEVAGLNTFTPNNEVSERSLMTPEQFVGSYFANTDYAKRMIDTSVRAIAPKAPPQIAATTDNVTNTSEGERLTSKVAKRISATLIVLPIVAVVLLFSFPTLHATEMDRRLSSVSLPLSNIKARGGTNGIIGDRTNISFTVNKQYASSLEATEDIDKQLKAAGISILQSGDAPSAITHRGDAATESDEIKAIEIWYSPNYRGDTDFIYLLEQEVQCGFESTGGPFSEYRCEGEDVNEAYIKRLAGSRAVSSVSVYTSVKYFESSR